MGQRESDGLRGESEAASYGAFVLCNSLLAPPSSTGQSNAFVSLLTVHTQRPLPLLLLNTHTDTMAHNVAELAPSRDQHLIG